ncbi:MAG: acyl-[acyl-carrier-protein]--UDP-N-acetylglucosamine O-acyltransferase, partial [Phycisphaerales bacterium]
MPLKSANVRASAHIDASAQLGNGVVVEPDAYIGPNCVIGAGSRIMARAMVLRDTVMGADNVVHPYAVLGGDPQDVKYDEAADAGRLEIGDGNQFREHVTVSRGAGAEGATRIGAQCFFMAGAHVGHNAKIGDRVILTNQAAVAGHVW